MKHLHYRILGFFCLGLGFIGALLPVMPTTVFVIIAAWCFAKSSPRWHQRLLNSRLFGTTLKAWEEQRCIPPKARIIAISSMLIFGTLSFFVIESALVRGLLISLLCLGIGSVHYYSKRRPARVCPHHHRQQQPPQQPQQPPRRPSN